MIEVVEPKEEEEEEEEEEEVQCLSKYYSSRTSVTNMTLTRAVDTENINQTQPVLLYCNFINTSYTLFLSLKYIQNNFSKQLTRLK